MFDIQIENWKEFQFPNFRCKNGAINTLYILIYILELQSPADFQNFSELELLRCRGIGKAFLVEVKRVLKDIGLKLKDDPVKEKKIPKYRRMKRI